MPWRRCGCSWPSWAPPKDAKTRIVHLREGGEGFDFLGFHHRYVRGRTRARATSPSSLAGPHARRCSTPATGSVS